MDTFLSYLSIFQLVINLILLLLIRSKKNTIERQNIDFQKQIKHKEETIALLRSDLSTLCAFCRRHVSEENRAAFRFYYDLYGAADIDIPNDVYFINGYIPVKGNISESAPFGDFTVYISPTGKCYHSNRFCSNQTSLTRHAYDVVDHYYPCSKCAAYFSRTPQWYLDVKRIIDNSIRQE